MPGQFYEDVTIRSADSLKRRNRGLRNFGAAAAAALRHPPTSANYSYNSIRAFFATLFTGDVWERRRVMSKRPSIAATFAFKCALLFLACAVFSWGLQAKLSLYKTPQSPSNVTAAKLLTERRSSQTVALLEKALKPDAAPETLNLIPLLVLAQAILFLTFKFYQVEMNLCRSRRWNFHDPHLTQRPPPSF